MLTIQKLPPERQRNTAEGLSQLFQAGHSFDAEVAKQAQVVIQAAPVVSAPQGPSLPVVDRATDSVVNALFQILTGWEKGLHGRLVPLDAAQQKSLDAAELLQNRWFASGTGFLQRGAGIEYDGLRVIEGSLGEPQIQAAVALLGIGPLVNALVTHTGLYRQALGLSRGTEAAKQDWHEALQLYAASVLVAYPDKAETRQALLAPYTKQLDEHRADLRAHRKASRRDPA